MRQILNVYGGCTKVVAVVHGDNRCPWSVRIASNRSHRSRGPFFPVESPQPRLYIGSSLCKGKPVGSVGLISLSR